jgi:hypothetical protein
MIPTRADNVKEAIEKFNKGTLKNSKRYPILLTSLGVYSTINPLKYNVEVPLGLRELVKEELGKKWLNNAKNVFFGGNCDN